MTSDIEYYKQLSKKVSTKEDKINFFDQNQKAFYVDIADMKEHGVLGGENSLYNKFKDQAQDFKDSLPEIKIDGDTKILDITNRGGTNKHGLPDIKIGGGFKW